MKDFATKTLKCRICNSSDLVPYLDLGKNALANSFIDPKNIKKEELKFELKAVYCKNCHLAQLSNTVDKSVLFSNYKYFSSASKPLEPYFKEYAKKVEKLFPKHSSGFIVEIGSNDGILLQYFNKKNAKKLGIDPAKNIAKTTADKGITTLPLFFTNKNSEIIKNKHGQADIIIANHVLAHISDLHDTISGVKNLLDKNGIFIFEVQYLKNLLEKNQFDNTYHEHSSYFSLKPLVKLLGAYGLTVFIVEKTNAQGGSIRVYSTHKDNSVKKHPSVNKTLKEEEKSGLYELKTFIKFGKKPEKLKKDLQLLLSKIKKQGKKISAYGASAKGNTLLQYLDLKPGTIDYIVDTTKAKQGTYTPGTHIPVFPPEHLYVDKPDYVLILAWNYADLIIKNESKLVKLGVKFIVTNPIIRTV